MHLSKLKNIIGIKDATGDVSRVSDTRKYCGENFIQLSGEDASSHLVLMLMVVLAVYL